MSILKDYVEFRDILREYLSLNKADVSQYWMEEISSFGYLFEAGESLIHKLREHTFWLTGDLVYRYKNHHIHSQFYDDILTRHREMALRWPDHKYVYEPDLLGGFGFNVEGKKVNIDNLKFNESAIAMGFAFPELAQIREPRFLEIGGGWGGMAFVLKSIYPNARFTIIDLPHTLIFTSTYLRAAFPESKIRIGKTTDNNEVDFQLVPANAVEWSNNPNFDLALNICSFQEMTSDQVYSYAKEISRVTRLGLYSHNRLKGPYNKQIVNVDLTISECFRMKREVFVLPTDYTHLKTKVASERRKKSAKGGLDNHYRHIVYQVGDYRE